MPKSRFDSFLDSITTLKAKDLNYATRTYREKHGGGEWRNTDAYFEIFKPKSLFRADICLGVGEPYIPERWYVFATVPEKWFKRADQDQWQGEVRGPMPHDNRYDRIIVHPKPKPRIPITIGREDVSKIRKVGGKWLIAPGLRNY